MKRQITITETKLRDIIKTIVEQVEGEYYKISPEEYLKLMKLSGYHGKGISKLPKFQGKPLWITGDVELSNTPTDSLGNVGYVDGRLDISRTNVSTISGIKVTGRIWDGGTPIERKRLADILAVKMAEADERRLNDEWSIENADEEGLKANALFEWLVGRGDIKELDDEDKETLNNLKIELEQLTEEYDKEEESDRISELYDRISEIEEEISDLEENSTDVYNMSPLKYKFFGMEQFEVIGVSDLDDREYSVGTYSEMEDGALNYAKEIIDDSGIEGYRDSFLEDYIDEDYLISYADELISDDVHNSPESFFNDDDFELTTEQEERQEQLETYIEELQTYISGLEEEQTSMEYDTDNEDEYERQQEELQLRIDDATENSDNAQEELDSIEPDTEPTQDMIDSVVENYVRNVRRDPIRFIRDYGLEIKDFIDEDELAKGLVESDGWGIMNSNDGQYDSESFNGEEYYIMITQ